MEWIALSISVLGVIYFAVNYSGFRRALLYAAGAGTALLAAVAVYLWVQSGQDEQRYQLARSLINSTDIEVADATLSLGVASEIKAAVTNNSPYELTGLALKITVTDCPRDLPQSLQATKNCAVVGDDIASDFFIAIPPRQKRAFSAYVSFRDLPELKANQWSWTYSVQETRGRRIQQ